MKKILAILISVILLVGVLPLGTLTASAATSGTTGSCTWTLDGTVLTISGSGTMGNYYWESTLPWGKSITTVIIQKGVTRIGNRAFYDCRNLTSVTIPDSVTSIGDFPFYNCTSLTSINVDINNAYYSSINGVLFNKNMSELICYPIGRTANSYSIPDSVTSIGRLAFGYCPNLTSITIPDSVTSIGYEAFRSCEKLKSISIPNSVTNIDNTAFYDCKSLTNITIGNSVTSIGDWAFGYCTSLTNITIGNSVTSIGDYAFYNYTYKSLKNVYYCGTEDEWNNILIGSNNGDLIDATRYYHNFKNGVCTECNVISKDMLTYTVTNGKATITDCYTSLSGDVTIPSTLGGYPVTSIGNDAFYHCESLTTITMPDSVTRIGDRAFSSCYSLTHITLPDSVTSIGYGAFSDCSSLTSITIPDSVTSIGDWVFGYCTSLTSITVDNNNNYYSSLNGLLFNKDKTELIRYPAGKNGISYTIPDSVTSIDEDAFGTCTILTSITIPDSVTSIGRSAFWACISLTSITIPNSVTSIGQGAFYYCTSLTSITIPDSVTSIGDNAFYLCENLTSITIPDSVTSIGDGAFHSTSLTTVHYCGTEEQWNKISIDDGFLGNSYLIYATRYYHNFGDWQIRANATCTENGEKYRICSVCGEEEIEIIPSHNYNNGVCTECNVISEDFLTYTVSNGEIKITKCDTSISGDVVIPAILDGLPVTQIGDGAFDCCELIKSIIIPDSVTYIGATAFYMCSSLENISIPNGVKVIENGLFSDCCSLKTVYWSDKITRINACAFENCSSLTNITIPNSVTYIGFAAFRGCSSLENIVIPASVETIDDGSFHFCDSLKYICVSSGNKKYCDVDGVLFDKEITELISYPIGNDNISYVIPATVVYISPRAFQNELNLKIITIPYSMKIIGLSSFYGCDSIETVYYCGTEEDWNKISIDDGNSDLINATKYYHNFSDWQIRTNSTCTENGEKYRICSICGEEETDVIPPLGHLYESFVTPPTCTENGYTTHTCENCGDSYTSDYIAALGHRKNPIVSITNSTTYPFAFSDGIYSSTNKANNSSSTFTITALVDCEFEIQYKTSSENTYDKLIIKQNSTTKVTASGISSIWKTITLDLTAGDKIYITYSKDVSLASGNDAIYFKININISIDDFEPTCVDDVLCDECGAVVKPATGHTYTNVCDEVCDICGDIRIAEHAYDNACDTECNICGFIRITTHNYPKEWTTRTESTCTENGEKYRLCSVCGDEEIATIGALGHNYNSVVTPPACTEEGYTTYTCENCGDSYTSNHVPPTHNFGDWQTKIEVISCTSNGEQFRVCSICEKEEVLVIEAHNFKDGVCTACKVISEKMFTYTINNSEATITNCNKSVSGDVVIPSILGGYPVTSVGKFAFCNCALVTAITIPDSVTSIEDWAFFGCSSLTSVTIGNSVTTIGDWAFFDCSSLASVTISNSVTTIGEGAFEYCTSLTSVTIGNSVTTIGEGAFYNCSSLTSVTIGNSVTTIGVDAFSYCSNLTNVYYCGTEEEWNDISIGLNNECLTNTTRDYITTGDLNGDGTVDIRDLVRLKKILAESEENSFAPSDIDGDGNTNANDLTILKKFLLGIITDLKPITA